MESYLAISPLPGMFLWALLYVSDYYLTFISARGFREVDVFRFEGSLELTPQFQKDINEQNRLSKRHISYLVIYTFVVLISWLLAVWYLKAEWLYLFYLGAFLLLEVAVHFRHFRNLRQISILKKIGGVEGTVIFRKRFSYMLSAFDLYSFAALFLLVSALTFSPFFLGGVLTCFATGFRHMNYARHEIRQHDLN